MKRIEIVIDQKGNSTVETKGFAGGQCVEASKFIEQALGSKTQDRKTAEFYVGNSAQIQQDQRVK